MVASLATKNGSIGEKNHFFYRSYLGPAEFSHFEEYLGKKHWKIQIYKTMKTDYIHKSHNMSHSIKHILVQKYINTHKFIFIASNYKMSHYSDRQTFLYYNCTYF